jgi:hypothetical protein
VVAVPPRDGLNNASRTNTGQKNHQKFERRENFARGESFPRWLRGRRRAKRRQRAGHKLE